LFDPIALGTAESTFIAGAAWVQRSTIRLLPYCCHSDDSANRNAANTSLTRDTLQPTALLKGNRKGPGLNLD
jgi:hypothetical protein